MIGALLLAAISYGNPVIFADYSDPDVIRVGSDYYLVASSFQCVPGLPILHSRDLAHWALVNYAVRRLPSPDFSWRQEASFQPRLRMIRSLAFGSRVWQYLAWNLR